MDEVADVGTVLKFGNYSLGRGEVETRLAAPEPVRADGLEAARSLAWRCNHTWISRWDDFPIRNSGEISGESSPGPSRKVDGPHLGSSGPRSRGQAPGN